MGESRDTAETEVRVSPRWLRLREGPDAAARSAELAGIVRAAPPPGSVRAVHDLGCGAGSMGRWLSPLLDGPQHWVLHDLDVDLLRIAGADPPARAPGASPVTVETRRGDVTRLAAGDLAGASLVTLSALLDVLTAEELERLVRSCVSTAAPVLATLSVTGRVRLRPADPLDGILEAAFNDHQRRPTSRGPLLGPDAARRAVTLFEDLGWQVRTRPSPWRLGADSRALTSAWLDGWVGAAVEQRPELAAAAADHLARRTRQARAGDLHVTVDHLDLLATPPGALR
ncbi:MAG: class I SAM-dependent methyltransferase [Dermatophilaceae bacterium]